ncbi:LysM peptidoglycan-binding domain-containing protein, partial [Pseudooctadecabacter sp.]|uniref:LysM peptidoglycan-binding domain-containing protein n=1 Tax=Pseudooctadecabacter sp. TaxID=1966338 RepID=UPI0035C87DD0
ADPIEDAATDPQPEPVIEAEQVADPQNAEQVAQAVEGVEEGQSDAPQAVVAAAPDADQDTTVTPVEPEPEVAQGAVAPTPPTTPPATPAILAVTDEGVEIVQPAVSDRSPEVMSNVALDTITYAPDGDVVLGGRALGEGFVQVYVDNAPVSRLPVDADGTWRGDLPDVDTGVYTLRIDEVDTDGDVVSRIETPFLREDPVTVAEVLAEEVDDPGFTVATRTVQPGATLWAIAEERYGAGVLYVTVFEANRDRIRNPDLIYPGQVFVLPEDSN